MRIADLADGDLVSSALAYGCMRIVGDGSREARRQGEFAVRTAIDEGYTFFDHADVYAAGECEALFGEVLKGSPGLRDEIQIGSKCGGRLLDTRQYDLSAQHILDSVDGSLSRLGVDRLDLLSLHRPDYLMDVRDVAQAFDTLQQSGKVANFGVSNFSTSQFDALQASVSQRLIANQVELNLHNVDALSNGVLDQAQQLRLMVHAWCPLGGVAYEAWGNTFSATDERRVRSEVTRQANVYGVESWIVPLAWMLRLPANIVPLVGSTTPARIRAAKQALELEYSRDDWYRLFEARNDAAVP